VWRPPAYVWGRRAAARLTRPLRRVEIMVILCCDLERPLPEATARVPLETFVASHAEVLDEVAQFQRPRDPASRTLLERRLERGFFCFVGRVEGRLVAYNRTQYEPGEDGGSYVDLGPDEVHCLDAYTVAEFRGKNIHAALLREMLLFNAGLGYRRAYSKVSLANRRSPKAHRRLGWERTGTVLLGRRTSGLPVMRLTGSAHPWRRLRSSDAR
jgi:GNAT superfamily N-acetyltransferase